MSFFIVSLMITDGGIGALTSACDVAMPRYLCWLYNSKMLFDVGGVAVCRLSAG
jgi:hypothetical protein